MARGGLPELSGPGPSRPFDEADDGLPKIFVETPKDSLPQGKTPDILKRPLATPVSTGTGASSGPSRSGGGEAPKFSPGLDPPRRQSPSPDASPLDDPGRSDPLGGPSAGKKTGQLRPVQPADRPRPPAQPVIPVAGWAIVPGTDSAQVARVTLNRQACGGWDANGRSGDDGIRLLVEPATPKTG